MVSCHSTAGKVTGSTPATVECAVSGKVMQTGSQSYQGRHTGSLLSEPVLTPTGLTA